MAGRSKSGMITSADILLRENGYKVIKPDYCTCTRCLKDKKKANFYISRANIYKEYGILPICKTCLGELWNDFVIDTKKDKKLAMYKLTREIRMPWVEVCWQMAIESKSVNWQVYIAKFNSLPQYADFKIGRNDDRYIGINGDTGESSDEIESNITMKKGQKREAVARWGSKWNDFEMLRLEEFYHSMRTSNKIETPQDIDYLKKLARLSVKIDSAIENSENGVAKQLGDLYSKFMADSKFRAMDMTDSDKQGGIRTFGQIYKEVESEEFIPPWEKYAVLLKFKQDIIDKVIMHIENFTLRFNNVERMVEPPSDTPKIDENIDGDDNG